MPNQFAEDDVDALMGTIDKLSRGYEDWTPMAERYAADLDRQGSNIKRRRGEFETERDRRTIVDKIQPIAHMIGYLADRTSGDRKRRTASRPVLRDLQNRRQGRFHRQEETARRKFLDYIGTEEMFGKMRGQKFSALTGAKKDKNASRRSASASANRSMDRSQRSEETSKGDEKEQFLTGQLAKADALIAEKTGPMGAVDWAGFSDIERHMINTAYEAKGLQSPFPDLAGMMKDLADKELEVWGHFEKIAQQRIDNGQMKQEEAEGWIAKMTGDFMVRYGGGNPEDFLPAVDPTADPSADDVQDEAGSFLDKVYPQDGTSDLTSLFSTGGAGNVALGEVGGFLGKAMDNAPPALLLKWILGKAQEEGSPSVTRGSKQQLRD